MQMYDKPKCRIIGIAQTHKALKRVLVREIQIVCSVLHLSYEYNKSEQELTLFNDSVFYGYSGENPEAMLGLSEIDILVIDEALSVGDSNFKKKCKNKINELIKSGVTVLYVSHNKDIQDFCKRCIYLQKGKIIFDGTMKETMEKYPEFAN